MSRLEKSTLALTNTSKNAKQAFEAFTDPAYENVSADEKQLWAMSTIIHCDITRYLIACQESESEGFASLLWMGDFLSKLLGAEHWYQKKGAKLLLDIACRRGVTDEVKVRLKKLGGSFPINEVRVYRDYRNSMSSHYDRDALDQLKLFSETEGDNFFRIVQIFVSYSHGWTALSKLVIEGGIPVKES